MTDIPQVTPINDRIIANTNDSRWQIEGRRILCDGEVKYIAVDVPEAKKALLAFRYMDAMFQDAPSAQVLEFKGRTV